jgi:PHP family Zn ribbon phosphoesterase
MMSIEYKPKQTKTAIKRRKAKAVKEKTGVPPQLQKAGIWVCPRCNNRVEIFVKMTWAPACHNHIGGAFVVMELEKKTRG